MLCLVKNLSPVPATQRAQTAERGDSVGGLAATAFIREQRRKRCQYALWQYDTRRGILVPVRDAAKPYSAAAMALPTSVVLAVPPMSPVRGAPDFGSSTLSIARTTGDAAYSVFSNNEYTIVHRSAADLAGTPVTAREAGTTPTAAVLHALHYHATDVFEVQQRIGEAPGMDALLALPLAEGVNWSAARSEILSLIK